MMGLMRNRELYKCGASWSGVVEAEPKLDAARIAQPVLLAYGKFLQNTFDFIIVAFAIFLLVKGINSLKRKQEAAPAAPPAQEVLLTEIRDLLKAQKS